MAHAASTVFDDPDSPVCRHYTPSMLASLLGLDVRTIRAWIRRGLLIPVQEVHRLACFDYQGLLTARQLAKWRAEGVSARSLEADIARHHTRSSAPQHSHHALSLELKDGRLYARDDVGLVDPHGQRCFDFEDLEREDALHSGTLDSQPSIIEVSSRTLGPDEMLSAATSCEEAGDFAGALDYYRTLLLQEGPQAELNFALAELLYRLGDLPAARERYACALEIDAQYVEARANLGCVYDELGQLDLAIAAFRGTLELYADYADAHYHLAQLLDKVGDESSAAEHWQRFLDLSPESPWAEEARVRLGVLE